MTADEIRQRIKAEKATPAEERPTNAEIMQKLESLSKQNVETGFYISAAFWGMVTWGVLQLLCWMVGVILKIFQK